MKREQQNLYDLYPTRAVRWETGDDGRVVLLVPKFTNRLLVKLLVPLLRQKDFRFHLEELGSFVWRRCDGSRTIGEIGALAQERFPDAEGMAARVGEFVARLDKQELLSVHAARGAPSEAETTTT